MWFPFICGEYSGECSLHLQMQIPGKPTSVFKTKGKGKKTFSKSIQITGDRVRNVLFLFG